MEAIILFEQIIIQFLISFIATACFGVIFNVPPKTIPACGFVGAIGWVIYYLLIEFGLDDVRSSFIGAFAVSLFANFSSRKFKMPMIIFSVCGIIPLVPGGIAYNTMRNVIELDYNAGLQNGVHAFIISGALAMGIVFTEVLLQIVSRFFKNGKTSIQLFVKIRKKIM